MPLPEDQVTLDALTFLASTGSQLEAFRMQLKQAANLHASSFVECRYYGSEVYVCICLEVDVADNRTLTWWMDIAPKPDGWLIEASVLSDGRDLAAQFPAQTVRDFQAVQQEVPHLLRRLFDAGGAALTQARSKVKAASNQLSTRVLDEPRP
jgi:hypothetical protein